MTPMAGLRPTEQADGGDRVTATTERQRSHRIRVVGSGAEVICRDALTVLGAFERSGCAAVRVGCRNGGCGVCRIRVLDGIWRAGPMSTKHVSAEEQQSGYALACRVIPEGDLLIAPAPRIPTALRS